MTKGLYLHIPFCERKCNYCDFYSGSFSSETKERYVDKLCYEIEKWGRLNTCPIDTIYFGGGTPSLLTACELEKIMNTVRSSFNICNDAEITCEINPADDGSFIEAAAALGINRLSIGAQSSDDTELEILGRRHSFADAIKTVELAKNNGITNISIDIMIGLPESSIESLECSINDILSLDVPHISSYILKVEEGTPFYKNGILLPDDDAVADQYLFMCEKLQKAGYTHYEISNFAKPSFESKHNNKYWNCEEYIGIGPAAHSFFGGRRMYYPRSIDSFFNDVSPIDDGPGGAKEEFIMLSLRLSKGLVFSKYKERFGSLSEALITKARLYKGLCEVNEDSIRLTNEGMLISNNIITNLLEVL